jgi:hypothetical protein
VRLKENIYLGGSEFKEPVIVYPAISDDANIGSKVPGSFGERTVTLEDGALFLQRQGGPKLKMMPVAKDEFALERIPEARIKFARGEKGVVIEIHVLNRTGEWEKSAKQ